MTLIERVCLLAVHKAGWQIQQVILWLCWCWTRFNLAVSSHCHDVLFRGSLYLLPEWCEDNSLSPVIPKSELMRQCAIESRYAHVVTGMRVKGSFCNVLRRVNICYSMLYRIHWEIDNVLFGKCVHLNNVFVL